MIIRRTVSSLIFTLACAAGCAQVAPAPVTIALTVPDGTPLQIVLDKEVHIRRVGQPIQGRVVQPVYVFDHLVIPVGTLAEGRISEIAPLSGKRRTLAILNGDFTPAHLLNVDLAGSFLPMAAASSSTRRSLPVPDRSSISPPPVITTRRAPQRTQPRKRWRRHGSSGKMR